MAGVATFAVLGPLEVSIDGTAVKVAGRRERAVLAVLLAARGEALPAERLIDEIWGEAAAASSASSLQVAVSRLRALLEPDRGAREAATLLVSVGTGYALRTPAGSVDADRAVELVRTAETSLTTDCTAAVALCEQAAQLWRGTPYTEAGDGETVLAERIRLEELRLHVQEVRAEAALAAGRPTTVTGDLEALVVAHPFRERFWELYALALYRGGRQAEALAALETARKKLATELGVDPSPALQQLQRDILTHSVAEPAGVSATVSAVEDLPRRGRGSDAATAPGRPPLVGRDAELGQLRGALVEARNSATVFALVEGQPGIGKTRLLEELAATATGTRVVWGRCPQVDVAPAFWPWREVVRALAADGLADRIAPDAAALSDPDELADAMPTQERRFRLFDAIARTLAAAAADRPLLVLVEDLHWADAASADLLHHLVDTLYGAAVAIVGSSRELDVGRDDAVADAVGALSRRGGSRRVAIGAVSSAASPALVAGFAERQVPAEVAAAIHRRADGNPFCIAELTRLLASSHLLDDVDAVDRVDVPAGVRDVIRQRLSALPEDTRRLLEVAAVIGREFDLPLLVAASGLTFEACLERLEPALVSRVIAPLADVPGRHRFAHALVTEAALADLTSLSAARLHAAVAEALVAGAGDPEVVAGHLWSAAAVVGPARAAEALERAADVSVRRTAYEAGQDLLERALSLRRNAVGAGPDADEAELVTTLRLAGLRRARFGYSAAFEAIPLDRPKELVQRSGRTDLYLGLLHLHWGALATSCQVEAATDLARQMYELGASSDDAVVRLLAEQCWGVQCWHLGRLREAASLMARVDSALWSLSAEDQARLAMFDSPAFFSAFALHILEVSGHLLDADPKFEGLFRSFTSAYEAVVVVNFAAFSAVCVGDAERALRWARRGMRVDNGRDFGMFGATAQAYGGWALAMTGEAEEGLALLDVGLARFRASGARTAYAAMVAMRAEAMLAAQRPTDDVARDLEAGAAEAAALGEPLTMPYLDLARAQLAAATGRAAAVPGLLDRVVAAADEQGNAALVTRVRQVAARPTLAESLEAR